MVLNIFFIGKDFHYMWVYLLVLGDPEKTIKIVAGLSRRMYLFWRTLKIDKIPIRIFSLCVGVCSVLILEDFEELSYKISPVCGCFPAVEDIKVPKNVTEKTSRFQKTS